MRSFYPRLADLDIAETWAGCIETTPDAIPIMCAVDKPVGYFIATGFSGHGFGMGPAAGLLMSELVQQGTARIDMTPFHLDRFTAGAKLEPFSII